MAPKRGFLCWIGVVGVPAVGSSALPAAALLLPLLLLLLLLPPRVDSDLSSWAAGSDPDFVPRA